MRYFFVILILLVVILGVTTTSQKETFATKSPGSLCKIERGISYEIPSFQGNRVNSWQECCKLCGKVDRCRSWTFNEKEKLCRLKDQVRPNKTPMTDRISGLPHRPFKYVGCFKDDSKRRLKGFMTQDSEMTPEKCINICRDKNFQYAGVQYGRQCFCDNEPKRGLGKRLSESACKSKCAGDKKKICGDSWKSSVYTSHVNKKFPPAPKDLTPKYLGCFKDDSKRHLNGHYLAMGNLTPEKCFAECRKKKFKYASLQAGRQCFCDNKPKRGFGKKMPNSQCAKPCSGDKSKKCGGQWRNAIYDLTQTGSDTSGTSGNSYVTLFEDTSFKGKRTELPVGEHNMRDLKDMGYKNDSLSSIKVPKGKKATLFQHDKMRGKRRTVTSDLDKMPAGWNDYMSSVIVQ
jgi:hypothetical protein